MTDTRPTLEGATHSRIESVYADCDILALKLGGEYGSCLQRDIRQILLIDKSQFVCKDIYE